MVLELIQQHFTLIKIYSIVIFLIMIITGLGIFLFYLAMKKEPNKAFSFVNKVFAGITGGLIVAMLLDVKEGGGNILGYIFVLAVAILFIGIMAFIITPRINKNKK